MKIVAAQMRSAPGDIVGNIERHVHFIERAASCGGAAVLFPEMSLTGYEPRLAEQLAMTPDDARLEVFQSLSDRHQILVAVGGPYRGNDRPEIGMFVFRSGQAPAVYTKQMLHPDELPYFKAGNTSLSVTLGGNSCPRHLLRVATDGKCIAGQGRGSDGLRCQCCKEHDRYGAGSPPLRNSRAGAWDERVGMQRRGPCRWIRDDGRVRRLGQQGALKCRAGTGDEALVVYDLADQSGSAVALPAMGTLRSAG